MTRAVAVAAVFERARAAGKTVYGFASGRPSCGAVKEKDLPADFDHLAVEGDSGWTRVPPAVVQRGGKTFAVLSPGDSA